MHAYFFTFIFCILFFVMHVIFWLFSIYLYESLERHIFYLESRDFLKIWSKTQLTISIIFAAPGWPCICPNATSCLNRLCSSKIICFSSHDIPPDPVKRYVSVATFYREIYFFLYRYYRPLKKLFMTIYKTLYKYITQMYNNKVNNHNIV